MWIFTKCVNVGCRIVVLVLSLVVVYTDSILGKDLNTIVIS